MKTRFLAKKKKLVFLLFLSIGMISINFNLTFFGLNFFTNNQEIGNFYEDNNIDNDFPVSAEYQTYDGNGQNLNITLHQSLVDTTTKQYTNLDLSNSFTEPFPIFSGYNTSFINISISNINAPNKTLDLEKDTDDVPISFDAYYAFSFEVLSNATLKEFEVCLTGSSGSADAGVGFQVWNANWTGSAIVPDANTGLLSHTETVYTTDDKVWHKISPNIDLSPSNTDNDTFFIVMWDTNVPTSFPEFNTKNDGPGEFESLVYYMPVATWVSRSYEICANVTLTLSDNTPKPTEIGLKVNNYTVSDNISGENNGNWISEEEFDSITNSIEFILSAGWWNVSCDVTRVQINYTKSDLIANTEFTIPSSGQDVRWNVTNFGGLNYFDSRINDFNTINYTIPRVWNDGSIRVFNGTVEQTMINKQLLDASYREVQVLNAGNGTFWYLNATSSNLISSIDTYVDGSLLTEVNFTNILRFNASFKEIVDDGNVNLSVYSPPGDLNHSSIFPISTSSDVIFISDWDISDDVSTSEYGVYLAQLSWNNDTAAGFLEKSITIIGNTELFLNSPLSEQDHYDNELFDIIIAYNDTGPDGKDIGIIGADITENSTKLGAAIPTGTPGEYSLQLDTDVFPYGWNYIEISANQTFYHNQSILFSFHHRINTTINPDDTFDFGDVIRGDTVSYTFNYSDVLGNPILGATIQEVSMPSGGLSNSFEVGGAPGNYTIEIDTSNMGASVTLKTCTFNITATGNETQTITLLLTVTQAQTSVTITSFIGSLNRKDGFDQQIEFFFNDTDNDMGVTGVPIDDIIITDNQTGSERATNSLNDLGGGNYRLNISILDPVILDSGWIQFGVNVSKNPDYNWSINYFTFYLRGNLTITSIESIRDLGGEGILTPTVFNYSVYVGLNLNISFTILDTDFGNEVVTGDANSYMVTYYQIHNPTNQGTLSNTLDFDFNTDSFKGNIFTSNLATLGTYAINITILKTNYETSIVKFNLTLKAKILVNVSVVDPPVRVNAGSSFNLMVKAEYYNGTSWVAFNGIAITLIKNFNGVNDSSTATLITNINGTVTFTGVTVDVTIITMILYVEITSAYNHTGYTRVVSGIDVIPPVSPWTELLPYLIIAGIALLAVVGAVGVYRGVVVPKKREKQRVLTEVKTIFDDAINLEHILVLYKATGTCIFFKSYGSEEIDPELISGFLTAVSSFGKEMVAQEALNEISYGDKMLLLADGEYVRVALVLGKKGSLILRTHLKQFIDRFEQTYNDILPKWRGQLAYFRNAGEIVDEILNTSIILPHQISYDFSSVKDLKNPHSKDVLKIAHSCCEETERQFFFIATLLQEAGQNTNKDTAEIFMGIKELRDKKILMPIEISAIEAVPISQQEINLINQKVGQLSNLSPEEKQKLVNDLAQLGPAEREAYLSSLSERKEIVSAPIKTTIGTVEVGDKKTAKKEMKNLVKKAKSAKSEGEYSESIDAMRTAAMLASNWDFPNEFMMIQEQTRKLQIEDLKIKKKEAENAAKVAVKQKIYSEAAANYKSASKIASEIFKLGDPSMTKEVKRLTNKANEYEKLS